MSHWAPRTPTYTVPSRLRCSASSGRRFAARLQIGPTFTNKSSGFCLRRPLLVPLFRHAVSIVTLVHHSLPNRQSTINAGTHCYCMSLCIAETSGEIANQPVINTWNLLDPSAVLPIRSQPIAGLSRPQQTESRLVNHGALLLTPQPRKLG